MSTPGSTRDHPQHQTQDDLQDEAQDRVANSRLGRRNDPDRRDRIIDACLEVIARSGVAGTSHRKVATEAGVPLGAMTYYFEGMDELLSEAFARFAETISDKFEQRMTAASDATAAREAVVAIIVEDLFNDERELVLSHELYTLAARDRRYRFITTRWMARSRTALERHFDPLTARLLDALIEGLSIHRALNSPREEDQGEIELAVRRITNG